MRALVHKVLLEHTVLGDGQSPTFQPVQLTGMFCSAQVDRAWRALVQEALPGHALLG